jgi:hypothetical protein
MANDETSNVAKSLPTPTSESEDRKQDIGDVANESASSNSNDEKEHFAKVRENVFARTCWKLVTWTPKRCRWNPDDPPKFSMSLNLVFAFVSTFLLGCARFCQQFNLILSAPSITTQRPVYHC